jgi:hypothetical protein
MTPACVILDRLAGGGVRVRIDPADPGRLLLAPQERLTDDLLDMVRENKAVLLAALRGPRERDLERRRQVVADQLRADPALKYAFDVRGASPARPAPGPVCVMVGLRDADGRIVTGELHISAEKWPGLAVFTAYWREAAERRSS